MRRGLYYRSKFANKAALYGENVILIKRIPGQKCAGAFNPYTGEYDPARDRQYHKDNPGAPTCKYGYVGEGQQEVQVKAFVAFSLSETYVTLLQIDELKQGDIVIFYPYDVDISMVESVRYPITGNNLYSIIKRDGWNWDNTLIYQYTVGRLLTTSE